MKFIILILFTVLNLSSFVAYSAEKKIGYDSYNSAEKSMDYIYFGMSSTKLGFITSSFKGYVKAYRVMFSFDKSKENLTHLMVDFDAKSMDTDIDARNEKMWELCLEAVKYPKISVMIEGTVKLSTEEKEYDAVMLIRGKKKNIKVKLVAKKDNDGVVVEGTSNVSLKDLEIPDPSIVIASVNDTVEIHFKSKL